jgi:5-formyltetrahydrofolate cyclo-ligase
MPSHTAIVPADIRKQKRELRRQLTDAEQTSHAISAATRVANTRAFRNCKRVAAYIANDGELDPEYIIDSAWRMRKQVFLPVLSPFQQRLYFAPFNIDSKLQRNCFGIPEPACHPSLWLKPQQLDLILLPLVAFDENGNRIGMGGGFYDRTLAYMKSRTRSRKPVLIGLAHELQRCDDLVANSWDIPVDMIASEQTVRKVGQL